MTISSALAFVLVLSLFFGNAALGRINVSASTPSIRPSRLVSWWCVCVLTMVVVAQIEGLPLRSIGVCPPDIGSLGWGVVLFLIAFMVAGAAARIVMPALGLAQDKARASAIANAPLALQLALSGTAAVMEELICRGFVMSRLVPISPTLAVIASVVVFTLPHAFSWRLAQLVFVAPLGLVFSLFFLWRADLLAVIIAHFLVDTAGFLMLRMARR
jgi:uncharacterized protein